VLTIAGLGARASGQAFDAECHAPPSLLQTPGGRLTVEYALVGLGTPVSAIGGEAKTPANGLFGATLEYGRNNGGDGAAGLYLIAESYSDLEGLLFPPRGLDSRARASLLLLVRAHRPLQLSEPFTLTFDLPRPVAVPLQAFYSDEDRDGTVPATSVERVSSSQFRATFPAVTIPQCAAVILTE